jgi:hypothetical protein
MEGRECKIIFCTFNASITVRKLVYKRIGLPYFWHKYPLTFYRINGILD